jgi:hypothetical protein
MTPVLDLRRDWILPGHPDPYGIDQRLAERKEARLNGVTLVRAHERRAS